MKTPQEMLPKSLSPNKSLLHLKEREASTLYVCQDVNSWRVSKYRMHYFEEVTKKEGMELMGEVAWIKRVKNERGASQAS